jgi:hypothetical protein
VKFAYADPPYYGCASLYRDHPDAARWDTLDAHRELIADLSVYDGWALSMTSSNLHDLLPLCPRTARIAAWTKPFAAFKKNVNPGYTWEPVVFVNGRKRPLPEATVKDHIAASITLQRGLTGAKPEEFCRWILDLIGWRPGDQMDDLFPGTGVMGAVVDEREGRWATRGEQCALFEALA